MSKLPTYKCHKEVNAAKIAVIEFEADDSAKIALIGLDYIIKTDANYKTKFRGDENDLGYYVIYQDGYVSWSPIKAFEEGYTRVD